MAKFIGHLPQEGRCIGSCHDWRQRSRGDEHFGHGKAGTFLCLTCGAKAESALHLSSAPDCTPQIIPISWLPEKMQKIVRALRTEDQSKETKDD